MTNDEVLKVFEDKQALLRGHFLLSSGKHSSVYLQCAKVLMDPKTAADLCGAFIKKMQNAGIDLNDIDMVISPAMGGVVVGYEVARQLGVPSMFTERVDGKLEFRRGFEVPQGAKILMMEDVVTTGLSSKECIKAIEDQGGKVVAAGCLINRSGGKADVWVPLISLTEIDAPLFDPTEIPDELADIPAIKPGSRFIKK